MARKMTRRNSRRRSARASRRSNRRSTRSSNRRSTRRSNRRSTRRSNRRSTRRSNKALRRSTRRNNRIRNFLFGGFKSLRPRRLALNHRAHVRWHHDPRVSQRGELHVRGAPPAHPDGLGHFDSTLSDQFKHLLKSHKEEDLIKAAKSLTKDLGFRRIDTEGGVMDMNGGMDPSALRPSAPRPSAPRRRGPKSDSAGRRGGVSNRRNARRDVQMARRGVLAARARGQGPQDAYVSPPDTRTIWNPDTHGEMVIYWNRIFKYSFKTLFMIVGTNSYVATGAVALTVGQLFGTLDKLLITIVSIAIGSTCAGVATYTGAAAATIALYTLIKGAYDRVAGQSREDFQVNVAAQCIGIDQNIRGHVVETAQELKGIFTSPSFLQLIASINSTADFASGACAGIAMSRFIRKIYRPPPLPDGSPEGADPWSFAMARRRTPSPDGDQIYLFDKWGAVSIPVIFPVADIAEEEEGRTRTMAFLSMGSELLSLPQQIQADRAAAKREKIVFDLSSAFARGGIDGSEDIVDILGMNLITAFHDYLTQMEGNPDPREIPPEELIYYLNTFISQWEEPIPEEAAEAFLLQEAILPEGDGGLQQQPELEPEMQDYDGNSP